MLPRLAVDFIQKPWDNARLLAIIEKQATRSKRTERKPAASSKSPGTHPAAPAAAACPAAQNDSLRGTMPASAREIGGDYYDFLDLGPGRLGVLLADVSGKGVAAALLTANLQASFRSQLELGMKLPKALLASVNKLFPRIDPGGIFRHHVLRRAIATRSYRASCAISTAAIPRHWWFAPTAKSSIPGSDRAAWSAFSRHVKCDEKSVTLAPGDVRDRVFRRRSRSRSGTRRRVRRRPPDRRPTRRAFRRTGIAARFSDRRSAAL